MSMLASGFFAWHVEYKKVSSRRKRDIFWELSNRKITSYITYQFKLMQRNTTHPHLNIFFNRIF